MKSLLSCLAFFLFTQSVLPCINRSGTRFNGEAGGSARGSEVNNLKAAIAANMLNEGAEMEEKLRGATAWGLRSDYAVALMFLGRNKEAVALLEQLEKDQPGEYSIAANLGTAYELSGNNVEALKWIKEGIKRDPGSHLGTEWLHVKILEAKLAQAKDPNYFNQHSVLNLDPASIAADQKEFVVDNVKLPWKQVKEAIQYQLGERLQFVKDPDPAVASLLFDYAAIEAAKNTLESAGGILQMALDYGYPAAQVEPLRKLYHRRIVWRERKEFLEKAAILGGVPLAGVVLIIYLRRRRKAQVSSALLPH